MSILLSGLCADIGWAQQVGAPLVLRDISQTYVLNDHVGVLADSSGTLTIRDVTTPPLSDRFAPSPEGIGTALDEHQVYWVRLQLRSAVTGEHDWLLEVRSTYAELYLPQGSDSFEVKKAGFNVPSGEQDVSSSMPPSFSLHLPPGSTQTIYLRLYYTFDSYASEGGPLTLQLRPQTIADRQDHLQRYLQGLFAGVMFAMALYNLFLFLSIRDRSYLYYVLMTLATGLFWMTHYGYLLDYFWPATWTLPIEVGFFLLLFSAVAYLLFSATFLNVAQYSSLTYKLLQALVVGFGGTILVGALGFWLLAQYLAAVLSLTTVLATTGAGIIGYRCGFRPARYFLIACAVFIVGVIVYVFAWFQLLPFTPVTQYSVQVGSGLEAVLLSLALADRIKLLKREKQEAVAQRQHAEALTSALKETNQLKTQLLSIAAHDLRSPLTSIQGFSQILQEHLDDAALLEFADIIFDTSERMLALIEDLLDTAAIESGKISVHLRPIDMAQVAEGVIEAYHSQAEEKQQQLQFETGEGDTYLVEADEDRLREAMDNLVSNAIKFTPQEKAICVGVTRRNGAVRFVVRDEGPGLSEEDKRKLFSQFQRLSAQPTGNEPSTGLGLFITKHLVELHGGTVWAESEQGNGSTFVIEIPSLEDV